MYSFCLELTAWKHKKPFLWKSWGLWKTSLLPNSSLVKRSMIPCRRKYNQALPKLWTIAIILFNVILSEIKIRSFIFVPNQTAIQSSNQNPVADEEQSRNYEKDISGTQSSSCKNTNYNVKVLKDGFHENDIIGSPSARCNMTCDRRNFRNTERQQLST